MTPAAGMTLCLTVAVAVKLLPDAVYRLDLTATTYKLRCTK